MFSPRAVLQFLTHKTSETVGRCERASNVLLGGRDITLTQTQRQSQRGFRSSARMLNLGERYAPTANDKKMLVWAKMYKSVEEVPKDVSYAQMRKARDLTRIRVNLGMAAATLIACIVIIGYGKSRQGSGDSLQERGLQWERDMQEKGRQERAAKLKADAERAG